MRKRPLGKSPGSRKRSPHYAPASKPGLTNGPSDGLRVGRETALRGAEAVDSLRASLANWFNFFNGYDPLFTWWMGLPFKHVDAGLQGYAGFLRDRVAPAGLTATASATPATPIPPAPAPKFNQVPDVAEIMALPSDEMIGVVQRFTGRDRIRPRRRTCCSRAEVLPRTGSLR